MPFELTNVQDHDKCKVDEKKVCHEKHTVRAGKAMLEIAVDIHTDFNCKADA